VENHVQHLLRKLRLPNRAALVRWAIEHGLA
jgi:DNA-binding CsgD family transcriptional regulator